MRGVCLRVVRRVLCVVCCDSCVACFIVVMVYCFVFGVPCSGLFVGSRLLPFEC